MFEAIPKRASKIKLAAFVVVAISLVAVACNHGGGEQSVPTTSNVVVVAPPTTSSTTTTSTTTTTVPRSAAIPESEWPKFPQVEIDVRYTLTAKLGSPDGQGRIRPRPIVIYANREGNEQKACFQDYGDDCYPSDQSVWFQRKTVFLVVNPDARIGDKRAEVLISTRPNGTTGWIDTANFEWSTYNHHIIINLSDRTLSVWEGRPSSETFSTGRELTIHTKVIIGDAVDKAPTPTSMLTYVEAKLSNVNNSRDPLYGTWILPLALFSDTLFSFQGGPPQVAIHGTDTPEKLGTPDSYGCIRVHNNVIERLVEILELGTPVSIIA